MSESASNSVKYTLDLRISYTECRTCFVAIELSRDALVCSCSRHWFCSPQCREQNKEDYRAPGDMEIYLSSDSLATFYSHVLHYFGLETLKIVKEYMRSKEGVSRIEIKKLAESGDWKAALVLGLTYEFRFVCESEECELAIRPPFEKSPPFSHRKAIKYYKKAAEQNSLEAFLALGRSLSWQVNKTRTTKDYLMKSSDRFKVSLSILNQLSFTQLDLSPLVMMKHYKKEEQVVLLLPEVVGKLLYRLDNLNFNSHILKEFLLISALARGYSALQECDPKPRVVCISQGTPEQKFSANRSVLNIIFNQKADILNGKDNAWVDPGVRMDAEAVFDPGYFQRLHHDQPMCVCPHDFVSDGNSCPECAQLAQERILSVYKNSFLLSRDQSIIRRMYSVIFSLESGLKKQDYFWEFSKYEVIIAIRVLALQPMDLHPLQLAKTPDIYWPIIHYYGSVYSALKDILDVQIVIKIYRKNPEFTPLPERRNRVDEEKYVIKCGHDSCVHLDWKYEFKQCSRCKLRRYCSPSCQKLDWKLHKKECFLRPGT